MRNLNYRQIVSTDEVLTQFAEQIDGWTHARISKIFDFVKFTALLFGNCFIADQY
jgi:hypothetical protein